jgi:kumamolisin
VRAGTNASYTPRQVAEAYDFPLALDGSGQTVAIVELGGGYDESDLSTYFSGLGVSMPSVSFVSVDGGKNSPGADKDADGEVMLDIEVIGAIAPAASIVVYFAPNTDQGFMDAVSTAVHDSSNSPSAVSISWGGPEDSWTSQARQQMEQIMIEAAALGVTVTVASGDGGSTDGSTDGKQHVDFPASAPHALACGGTSLIIADGQISSESVWNDGPLGGAGGGGISTEFPVPAYQSSIKLPMNVDTGKAGRGVPDVAGSADPRSGYAIRYDGAEQTVGGTSAVAPLWAALTALINQSLSGVGSSGMRSGGGTAGFMQPQLYMAGSSFHDITQGNNGSYSAMAGWDACTGMGSPDGTAVMQALGGSVSVSSSA